MRTAFKGILIDPVGVLCKVDCVDNIGSYQLFQKNLKTETGHHNEIFLRRKRFLYGDFKLFWKSKLRNNSFLSIFM